MRSHGIKGSPHLAPGVLVSGGEFGHRPRAPWEEGRPGRSGACGSRGTPPAAGLASSGQRIHFRCFQPPNLWRFVRQPPGTPRSPHGHPSFRGHLSISPPITHLSCTADSERTPCRRGGRGGAAGHRAEQPVSLSTLLGAARFGYEVHVLLTT